MSPYKGHLCVGFAPWCPWGGPFWCLTSQYPSINRNSVVRNRFNLDDKNDSLMLNLESRLYFHLNRGKPNRFVGSTVASQKGACSGVVHHKYRKETIFQYTSCTSLSSHAAILNRATWVSTSFLNAFSSSLEQLQRKMTQQFPNQPGLIHGLSMDCPWLIHGFSRADCSLANL